MLRLVLMLALSLWHKFLLPFSVHCNVLLKARHNVNGEMHKNRGNHVVSVEFYVNLIRS